jgi:hypothetical protein
MIIGAVFLSALAAKRDLDQLKIALNTGLDNSNHATK